VTKSRIKNQIRNQQWNSKCRRKRYCWPIWPYMDLFTPYVY